MTYSIEEIEEIFSVEVNDEALEEVADAFRKTCSPDDAVNLLGIIFEKMSKAAEENEDEKAALDAMSPLDKLGFAIREAFAAGAVEAYRILALENHDGIESLKHKAV